MKNNNSVAAAAANAARLEKMRKNLETLENAAAVILEKEEKTAADRLALLSLLNIAFHKSGKIEDIASIDGTAACDFCAKMRGAAAKNPLIICGYCYAAADAWKEAAWRRHKLNAKILSSVLFSADELQTVNIPAMECRINEDGDIINAIHAQNILRLAAVHPWVKFGFWFKHAAAVEKALKNEGIFIRDELPKNITFVQSSVLIGVPAFPVWFADCVFTVFPDMETTENAIARGAFPCNGRKCKECGKNCYNHCNHVPAVQYIAEYLRCSAEKREGIVTAYYEYMAENDCCAM